MEWVIARLKEPSSLSSLAALFTAAAVIWPHYAELLLTFAGIFGGGGIVRREGGQ